MSKFLNLSVLVFFFSLPTAVVFGTVVTTNDADVKTNSELVLENMSMDEFLEMNNKELSAKLGKKLKFKEKLAFSLVRKKLKRAKKKGADTAQMEALYDAGTSGFNIGGFLLGFLLGLVGVLITYLFLEKEARKWSWIGLGAAVVLLLVILLVAADSVT